MNHPLIVLIACAIIEAQVVGLAAYLRLRTRPKFDAPTPSPVASRIAKCAKCGLQVARYTPTPDGSVCANCQPLSA